MEDRLAKVFGSVLREYRLAAGFSQERLAQETDLHRTYISLLERGLRQPSLNTIFLLAKEVGCEPHQLIKDVQRLI